MPQLSQRTVAAIRPTNKVQMISDGGTGLYLKIETTGTKTYVWRWRVNGKHRKVTIGRAQSIDCDAARHLALNMTSAAKQGRDPQLEAQTARNKVYHTVSDAWALYDKNIVSKQKSSHAKTRIFNADIVPYLGTSRLDAITGDDLRSVVKRAQDRANGAGRLVYTTLSAFLGWCTEEAVISTNPMFKKKWTAPAPRIRFLDEEEIGYFLKACAELRQKVSPATRWAAVLEVLLRTGARFSDIAKLKTAEVNVEKRLMTLPGGRHKSGSKYVLPVTDEVLAILESMPKRADGQFFGLTSKTRNMAAVLKRVNEVAGRDLPRWSAHCLRRTVDTSLRDAWDEVRDSEVADHFTIESILGHALPGVSKHYNQSTMERKKRRALDWWNAHLNALAK